MSFEALLAKMAEYKIKDLETLTGIKAHTIRIWEKRYGLLTPERTDTQIRTYTDEDLSRLLNVALLNKHGFKISKIATMSPFQIGEKVMEMKSHPAEDLATEKMIMALIDMDEQLFRDTFTEVVNIQGMQGAFIDTLIPFLDRIGIMWMVGSINPAQEHFISNLIRQKVIAELDRLPIPADQGKRILLFLPEHEYHEISLLFYNFILREAGMNTVYLGQSLPYDSLLECIHKVQPKLLVTSWLTSVDGNYIQSYFKRLRKDSGDLPVLAGGIQINTHISGIKDLVTEVTSIKDQAAVLIK